MKKWYKSKTLWFNVLVALAAVGGYIVSDQFPVQLSQDIVNGIVLAVAIINVVLRSVTSTSLEK